MPGARPLHDRSTEAVAELTQVSKAGIRPVDDKARGLLSRPGFIGVLPLWREASVVAGLQADPREGVDQWRGLIVKDGQALTLASSPATLLPRYLLMRFLADDSESLADLAAEWPRSGPAFGRLHGALGGDAASLDAVVAVLRDPTAHNALDLDKSEQPVFEAAMSRIARQIEPSASFQAFAAWLDAAIAGDAKPPEASERMGVWARQAVVWAAKLAAERNERIEISGKIALKVLEAWAGVDAGVPREATWNLRPGADSSVRGLVTLAEAADVDDLRDDPIGAGLVEAIRERGDGYAGEAHAAAVAAFDEGGDPERAWGALNAAAWWAAAATGDIPPAMLDGVRLLCERHDWPEIQWVTDQTFGGRT
jgi:hypothetical protein